MNDPTTNYFRNETVAKDILFDSKEEYKYGSKRTNAPRGSISLKFQ